MLLTTILELELYSSVLERDSSFRFRGKILFFAASRIYIV